MASSSNIILAAFGLAVVAAIRPVVIAGGGIDPNGGAGRSRLSSRLGGGLQWNQRLVLLRLRIRLRRPSEFGDSPSAASSPASACLGELKYLMRPSFPPSGKRITPLRAHQVQIWEGKAAAAGYRRVP
jgi:hypothetical protein